jgi:hypothetical protein
VNLSVAVAANALRARANAASFPAYTPRASPSLSHAPCPGRSNDITRIPRFASATAIARTFGFVACEFNPCNSSTEPTSVDFIASPSRFGDTVSHANPSPRVGVIRTSSRSSSKRGIARARRATRR